MTSKEEFFEKFEQNLKESDSKFSELSEGQTNLSERLDKIEKEGLNEIMDLIIKLKTEIDAIKNTSDEAEQTEEPIEEPIEETPVEEPIEEPIKPKKEEAASDEEKSSEEPVVELPPEDPEEPKTKKTQESITFNLGSKTSAFKDKSYLISEAFKLL